MPLTFTVTEAAPLAFLTPDGASEGLLNCEALAPAGTWMCRPGDVLGVMSTCDIVFFLLGYCNRTFNWGGRTAHRWNRKKGLLVSEVSLFIYKGAC